ncbi:MAG: T9SS type A sorting domain-containing protein [Elusimicrobia bacterium]|nr:T9SS type A sorting domain-containing protein [Elusimicrobiota bacterium]
MKKILGIIVFLFLFQKTSNAGWQIQTIDSEGIVGEQTSIAIDSLGNPHIAYYDSTNSDLKYARWTGISWSTQIVDANGYNPSIAIDSSNNPHIAYKAISPDNLMYAKWTGSSWSYQTIEVGNVLGSGGNSIILDSGNNPHISYMVSDGCLKYARWTGVAWSTQTADCTNILAGFQSFIILDSNNYPHISYWEAVTGDLDTLKYAKWTGSSWSIDNIYNNAGDCSPTSIALDSSANPRIAYMGVATTGVLKYVKKVGSSWLAAETVDSGGTEQVGEYLSMKLNASGNPCISYCHRSSYLKYAKWSGVSWSTETVAELGGSAGCHSSLALDFEGNPHISYHDGANRDLKYAKWIPDQIPDQEKKYKTTLGDNLFSPRTGGTAKIKFNVPSSGKVSLKIYDLSGKLVRTLFDSDSGAGDFQKDWNGKDDSGRYVVPGVYLLHYVYPGGKEVRKIGVKNK